MTRLFATLLSLVFASSSFASDRDRSAGQISGMTFTYKFGATPGLDQFDVTGTYVLGSGSDGIHMPGDAVVLSFDGGRFIQAIPSNSFTAISGGWHYQTTNPGIQLLKIMNNGSITIQVRKADFTGIKPTAFGPISLTVGDDVFTAIPNSVPVSKIAGANAANVGSTVTLDGTTSSDFNTGTTLTYTWSIVSQPLGSSVSLSTTNNSTTSFVPSKNGAYVVKLVTNDGNIDGVPALITVNASGGAEDPPPPPSPTNGLVTLSTNQPSYVVGESAVLTLNEDAQPGNGTSRWYFRATLNDAPITLTPVPNSTQDAYTSSAFTEAGTQVFKVDLYLENTNLAKALAAAITTYNTDIAAVDAALQYETDPAIIAQLQAQKAYDLEQIANAQGQLEQNRTKVGETAQLSFEVSE